MPTKKKTKVASETDAPQDPREPLQPTPANLTATLEQLRVVLAELPPPPPEPEPPARPKGKAAKAAAAAPADGEIHAETEADGEAEAAAAPASGANGAVPPAAEEPAPEPEQGPKLDLVDALVHIVFADGIACGFGQEARRRIAESFVDRNEFRVTEAFEVEDLLRDLDIPNLFDRCLSVRESIAQIYNDQNGVDLGFLRDAGVSDRNTFFQRVPAVPPHAVNFLQNLLTVEEICFSDKSTLRAQQRFGFDPKNAADAKFVDEVRALLKPYRMVPLDVGANLASGKPNLKHALSPAALLVRLGPAAKRR